jgi:pyruvate kinase
MRLTKIVCTLGPVSNSTDQIRALAKAGMAVARINFSHGALEDHRSTIRRIKEVNEKDGNCIAILLDTKGAEIRTGDLKEPIIIAKGQEVVFCPRPLPDEKRPVIHVNYDGFSEDVRETDRILLDNGEMSFDIVEIRADGSVLGRSRDDGKIGSRRHINLPGADIDLPSITDKDWEDLAMGVEEEMDYVALSFIRTAEEVQEVRAFLDKKKSNMRIIAKVENKQAVDNLDSLIAACDGIMVARGDLGAEIPFELIPAIQDEIVEKCRLAGKSVIVATHMLESMIKNPMPTRAEVTDIAHAAMTRTDATMLSGETAMGAHPLQAIDAMDRVIRKTEERLPPLLPPVPEGPIEDYQGRAEGAVTMAISMKVPAIVVLSRTGQTVRAISACRPLMPIIALTPDPAVRRSLALHYGVVPLLLPFDKDLEKTVTDALAAVKQATGLASGERVVIVAASPAGEKPVSTVHIRRIP